ncbi:Male sterility, NAD-binding protein, partial [Metarhizium hybridum]
MATKHEHIAQHNHLVPQAVDRLAQMMPDAEYGEWVLGSKVISITYTQLANIVNGLAWWLVKELNGSGYNKPQRETLTYIGPNDVRYSALVLAAVKAGFVIFVTSPRNSQPAQRALFNHLGCQTLITTNPLSPPAQAVLDAVAPARHLTVPSVEELLSSSHPTYVWNKTFEEVQNDPFVVMHTSGTTGLPKPIIWTHETCARVVNAKNDREPKGDSSVERLLLNGKRIIVTLPPFHGALLAQLIVGAIPYGNVVIAPVVTAIPTAQNVVDALKQTPADVAILVPSVVAELAQAILYIGGDLPQDLGDIVASKMYLRCQWGATETGIVPQLLPPELLPSASTGRELWSYVKFHPCVGAAFDEVADGIFELVVRRDVALADTQPCFTVPGIDLLDKEYRTRDLFEKHPHISGIWRWRARADDIIVFLNGEKANPISMEQHILAKNPQVSGALVIGSNRFQAALLVEPASEKPLTIAERAALIEHIWPSVDEANQSAPAHARVEKSFILVIPTDRRLIRSGKGTYMRGPSIAQYSKEIESLYAAADDAVLGDDINGSDEPVPHALGLDAIVRLVRQHAQAVTGWTNLGDADDFFDRGMDSLQGLRLTRALRRSLYRPDLALSTVYQNPSISRLAESILTKGNGDQNEGKVMEMLLTTYRGLIQQVPVSPASANSSQSHKEKAGVDVLFTGSTGTVGTYLLHNLLTRHEINHIFCLNRAEDGGQAAQGKSFAAAGFMKTMLDNGRVTFIKANLQQPQLGLDEATYEHLGAQVGLIIHAAWPVNFNLPLLAFRPQLAGIVNLFTFAAATTAARFVFISSVAAVEGHTTGAAPERVLNGLDTPAAFGYGRAKFLGELLMDAGARHFRNRIPATIIRIGQVAGAVQHPGQWNPREWLPSMIISSLYLGQVPNSLGSHFDEVDFVPVDLLADVFVDLAITTEAQQEASSSARVFNVRNAHLTSWRTLLPAITSAAAAHHLTMNVVPPATWIAALQASVDSDQADNKAASRNPAVKLLDFFSILWAAELDDLDTNSAPASSAVQPMAIAQALEASPALRKLGPVSSEWMRKWVDEWIVAMREE